MTPAAQKKVATADDPYFVESLARGLRVLSAFGVSRLELSQKEIADVAGVTVPSALRIGHTLVQLGYLIRNPSTKGYRLGPKVLSLGMATLSSMPLPEICEPFLAALRDETEETVKLAVLQGTDVVYIARFTSNKYESGRVQVGTRLMGAVTSMGRAILSKTPPDVARRVLEDSHPERYTDKTKTDVDTVMAELAVAAERGYALNDQEVTMEHRSIAAPLLDASGRAVAAVNISVSAQRVSTYELVTRFAEPLMKTARDLSSMLPPTAEYTALR